MDLCRPTATFDAASRSVLKYLHERLGFGLWMVTRTEGDNWIVLQAEDHGYHVHQGDVFRWSDSFCSQMVLGRGPRVAPCSAAIPTYANAPIGRQVQIGAYIGVPLESPNGELFGTLCAIDKQEQPETIAQELPLVEMLSDMLSTVLAMELKADAEQRRAERAEAEAMLDGLTGLFNRRGWDRLLAAEEERCRRYGNPACLLSIDLDGLKQKNDLEGHAAGDQLLQMTGRVVQTATRENDIVARVGGDEFAVLLVDADQAGGNTVRDRLQELLSEAGIAASVGLARRRPPKTLVEVWGEADVLMYEAKRAHKSQIGPRILSRVGLAYAPQPS